MNASEFQQWHEARHKEVKSTFGDLALEALIEINDNSALANTPGIWRPNTIKGTGLIVSFEVEEGVCDIEGQAIAGEIELETDQQCVAIDEHRFAMATAQPGSPYLLAIYNKRHEALTIFSHIDHFPFNEHHSYTGQYVSVEEQSYTFQHTGDVKQGVHEAGRLHQSSSIIEVNIAGQLYQLRPFASGQIDIIVFRDLTSDNDDTYEVGRMLVVEKLDDGKQVKLDFNKAFLPPCAFSPHFNCPMPPLSNRIKIAIEAGEKKVAWKDK